MQRRRQTSLASRFEGVLAILGAFTIVVGLAACKGLFVMDLPPVQLTPAFPLIKHDGITYEACISATPRPDTIVVACDARFREGQVAEAALGPELFQVRGDSAGDDAANHNQLQEGFGRRVPASTSFYGVVGHDPTQLLAARLDGRVVSFVRHPVSDVRLGADLIKVAGVHARFATVWRDGDLPGEAPAGAYFVDAPTVDDLARSIESGPADHLAWAGGRHYQLTFETEKTPVNLHYWSDPGVVLSSFEIAGQSGAGPLHVAIRPSSGFTAKLDAAIAERRRALAAIPSLLGVVRAPGAIAFTSTGTAWVADLRTSDIHQVGPDLARHDRIEGRRARLDDARRPVGIAIAPDGSTWIAEDRTVKKRAPDGTWSEFLLDPGAALADVAVGAEGDVWVAGAMAYRLAPDGAVLDRVTLTPESIGVKEEWQVAVDRRGAAWITDPRWGWVYKLEPSATAPARFAAGSGPRGIAIDQDGNVWIANERAGTVSKLSPEGKALGTFSVGVSPYGVALGKDGTVWVTDRATARLLRLSPQGEIVERRWTLDVPERLAIDREGNIWVSTASGVSKFPPRLIEKSSLPG